MNPANRQKLSMRITVMALALLFVSAGLFLYWAAIGLDPTALIPVVLIAAVMFLAWHAPGTAGILLLLFSPIGFLMAVLGTTTDEPQSQVIEGLLLVCGIPVISGALLLIASFVLQAALDERETSTN